MILSGSTSLSRLPPEQPWTNTTAVRGGEECTTATHRRQHTLITDYCWCCCCQTASLCCGGCSPAVRSRRGPCLDPVCRFTVVGVVVGYVFSLRERNVFCRRVGRCWTRRVVGSHRNIRDEGDIQTITKSRFILGVILLSKWGYYSMWASYIDMFGKDTRQCLFERGNNAFCNLITCLWKVLVLDGIVEGMQMMKNAWVFFNHIVINIDIQFIWTVSDLLVFYVNSHIHI